MFGRLMLKSILCQGRQAMDQWHALIGGIGFALGYWFRNNSEIKPDTPACHCQCQCANPSVGESGSGQGSAFWGLALTLVIGAVLVLSNVALVCKVSLRDNTTGTDREIQINVKGKSKGIHGASRGLSITG